MKNVVESSVDAKSVKDITTPNFTVQFISKSINDQKKKKTLHVTSLPLQFVCNETCIQNMLYIFFYPKPLPEGRTAADELIREKRKRMQKTNALVMATSGHAIDDTVTYFRKKRDPAYTTDDVLEIVFEAHAPKIIIPEDSSSEKGYLLFDMGYMKVRGFTCEEGMSWKISSSNVCAGMPLRIHDLYNLAEEGNEHMYLIKPFSIEMEVQNIDRTVADMVVDLNFEPGICGGLTPSKLTRLLGLMAVARFTGHGISQIIGCHFFDKKTKKIHEFIREVGFSATRSTSHSKKEIFSETFYFKE